MFLVISIPMRKNQVLFSFLIAFLVCSKLPAQFSVDFNFNFLKSQEDQEFLLGQQNSGSFKNVFPLSVSYTNQKNVIFGLSYVGFYHNRIPKELTEDISIYPYLTQLQYYSCNLGYQVEILENFRLALHLNVIPYHKIHERKIYYSPSSGISNPTYDTSLDKIDKRLGISNTIEYEFNEFVVFRIKHHYILNRKIHNTNDSYDRYSLFQLAYAVYL